MRKFELFWDTWSLDKDTVEKNNTTGARERVECPSPDFPIFGSLKHRVAKTRIEIHYTFADLKFILIHLQLRCFESDWLVLSGFL